MNVNKHEIEINLSLNCDRYKLVGETDEYFIYRLFEDMMFMNEVVNFKRWFVTINKRTGYYCKYPDEY